MLTATAADALGSTDINVFDTAQVQALTSTQIGNLSIANVSGFNTVMNALTATQLSDLTTTQVGSLMSTEIGALIGSQFVGLATDISSISVTAMPGVSADDLIALNTSNATAFGNILGTQVSAMNSLAQSEYATLKAG